MTFLSMVVLLCFSLDWVLLMILFLVNPVIGDGLSIFMTTGTTATITLRNSKSYSYRIVLLHYTSTAN